LTTLEYANQAAFEVTSKREEGPDLPGLALKTSLLRLREICQTQSWPVLCRAYRELSLKDKDCWAINFLLIENNTLLDDWIKEKEAKGEIRVKPGSSERWLVSPARA
jgi:hypothetical protein